MHPMASVAAAPCATGDCKRYEMNIPKKKDWGRIASEDIEGKYAFDMFIGKSIADAHEMCEFNALNYQEELQSLPRVPFNFYAPVLAEYIVSEKAEGDSDGASSFLHMVCWMLKTQRDIIKPETEALLLSASKIENCVRGRATLSC